MGTPMFSFVVPVYNVAPYLRQCLDSLIAQSNKDFEILLVNDGSTDGSDDICREYAAKDARIHYISQDNAGLSAARNTGIALSKGNYLLFIDSDDYIEQDACEIFHKAILSAAQTIDIVTANAIVENGSKATLLQTSAALPNNRCYSRSVFLTQTMRHGKLFSPTTCYCFRRAFLLKHQLYFQKGLLHEDEEWTPRVFLLANTFFVLDYPFYHYRIRSGSITSTANKTKNIRCLMDIYSKQAKQFEDIEEETLRTLFFDRLVTHYLTVYSREKLYKNPPENALSKLFLLKHAQKPQTRLKALLFFLSPRLYTLLRNPTQLSAMAR